MSQASIDTTHSPFLHNASGHSSAGSKIFTEFGGESGLDKYYVTYNRQRIPEQYFNPHHLRDHRQFGRDQLQTGSHDTVTNHHQRPKSAPIKSKHSTPSGGFTASIWSHPLPAPQTLRSQFHGLRTFGSDREEVEPGGPPCIPPLPLPGRQVDGLGRADSELWQVQSGGLPSILSPLPLPFSHSWDAGSTVPIFLAGQTQNAVPKESFVSRGKADHFSLKATSHQQPDVRADCDLFASVWTVGSKICFAAAASPSCSSKDSASELSKKYFAKVVSKLRKQGYTKEKSSRQHDSKSGKSERSINTLGKVAWEVAEGFATRGGVHVTSCLEIQNIRRKNQAVRGDPMAFDLYEAI